MDIQLVPAMIDKIVVRFFWTVGLPLAVGGLLLIGFVVGFVAALICGAM